MNINKNKKSGIWWYVLAFVLTASIYVIVIWLKDAYPFGNKCVLYEDAYVQYNTMLRTLIEFVHDPDKSVILWNHGLGVDFYLTFLYYLVSPFNIIVLVLGETYVELSIILIIMIKGALIAVTALYYFRHTDIAEKPLGDCEKYRGLIQFTCAMAIALCGYLAAYGQNIIWLDGLMLMPLIALAVEHVAAGRHYVRYTALLACAIIVNFYFSIYICMFVFVYYILYNRDKIGLLIKKGMRLLGLSLISILMSGMVLVPAFMCIAKAGDSYAGIGQKGLSTWGNIAGYVVSFFPFKQISVGYLYNNNNYCGAAAIMLLVIFLCNRKISVPKRVKYGVVLFILMLGANWLPLNYVLHGFTIPHGMGNRFAIILVYVVVIMAYIELENIGEVQIRDAVIAFVAGIAMLIIAIRDTDKLQVAWCYVGFLGIVVICGMIFVLLARKSIKSSSALILLCVIWCAELTGNAVYTRQYNGNDDTLLNYIEYDKWSDAYKELDDSDESRKTALIYADYTPASQVNWYSSMINGYYVNAFSSMGLARYDNVESIYEGTTPLTVLMYNVRYVLNNSINSNGGYKLNTKTDDYYIYEADTLADYGFMADESLKNWKADGSVAENQSSFIKLGYGKSLANDQGKLMDVVPWSNVPYDYGQKIGLLTSYSQPYKSVIRELFYLGDFEKTGIGDYIYTGTSTYSASTQLDFVADKDMELYVYSYDTRDQYVIISVDGDTRTETSYYDTAQLVYGGYVKEGQKVRVSVYGGASVGETAEKRIRLYSFNTDLFERVKPYITDETLISDGYEGNTFKGHITVKEDGVLYMAFPYSDGYTIYVDGKKAEKLLLGKGNMGVELTGGDHEIMLEYHTPGLVIGIVVSGVGLILFVLICIYDSRRKKSGME